MHNQDANQKEELQSTSGKLFAERFELLDRLAEGGVSTVYRARDILLDRTVALKLLDGDRSKADNFLQRFQDEARAGSRLAHPNIVQILTFGIAEGRPYLAMELIEGRTLESIFAEEPAFDKDRLKASFMGVFDALVFAHEQNIVHRDLKPANIMIASESAVPKVLDFGIAKILHPDNQAESKLTVGFSGSPLYMSPEQCAGKRADQRSDIYSLACVIYEAIAKKPPFTGETSFEVMYEHLNSTLPKLEDLSVSLKIPRQLITVIFKALSKNPADRPQTMSEFRQLFVSSLEAKELFVKSSARRDIPIVLIAVGLVSAVGLAGFFFTRQNPAKHKSVSDEFMSVRKSDIRKAHVNESAVEPKVRELIAEKQYTAALALASESLRKGATGDSRGKEKALYLFAIIYEAMGDLPKADQYLLKILELYPSPIAETHLVNVSRRANLYKDADLEKAIAIRGKAIDEAAALLAPGEGHFGLGTHYYELGVLLQSAGRGQDAVRMYETAMKHFDLSKSRRTTESVVATWMLFDAYMREGKKDKAHKELIKTRDALLVGHKFLPNETIKRFASESVADAFSRVDRDLVVGAQHSSASNINRFADLLHIHGFYSDAATMYSIALNDPGDLVGQERRDARDTSEKGLATVKAEIDQGAKDLDKM